MVKEVEIETLKKQNKRLKEEKSASYDSNSTSKDMSDLKKRVSLSEKDSDMKDMMMD